MQWHHNKMWTFDAMDDVMTIHLFVKGYPLIVEQSPLFLEIYPLFLEQLNSPYYDANDNEINLTPIISTQNYTISG
jgi:hypothetical protein